MAGASGGGGAGSGVGAVPVVVDPGDASSQVEAAESELRRLGLPGMRVRADGRTARLLVPGDDVVALAAEPLRREVYDAVRSAGFATVLVDLGATLRPARGARGN